MSPHAGANGIRAGNLLGGALVQGNVRALVMAVALVPLACGGDGKGGGGGAGGAGGAAAPDESAQLEEVAYESDLALSEVSAAADLAEGDVTATAVEKGSAPGGPDARIVRPDLARVLRQLARARGGAPCLPAPTVRTTTADAGCALIGMRGQYTSGVSVRFDACKLGSGVQLDGTLEISSVRALVDGATCDLAGISVKVETQATVGVRFSSPDGGRADIQGTGRTTTVRTRALVTSRTAELDHRRRRLGPAGATLLDQHLTGRAQATVDGTALVVEGTITADLALLGLSAQGQASGVRFSADCCHPTGGTWSVRASAPGGELSRTVAYGPECGQITVDGTPARLPTCL